MKNCNHCLKIINKSTFRGNWEYNRAKFCNSDCYNQFHEAKTKTLTCEFCKAIFIRKGCKGSKRFCSSECRYNNAHTLGTKYIDTAGYVRIKTGNNKDKNKGWEFEHRLVMEIKLNRKLNSNEHVHHIDENKQNNNPANLELFESNSAHIAFHANEYKERGEPLPFNKSNSIKKRGETRRENIHNNSVLQ